MTGYTVHLATRNPAGGEAQAELPGLDNFLDLLAEYSAAVAGGQAGWAATISVDSDDPRDALDRAHSVVLGYAEKAGLPHWPLVHVEILTDDEADRELATPTLPDLVSGPEIVDLLGISRQRLHQLRDNPRFPEPLIDRPGATMWARAAIDNFAAAWERRPGRPRRRKLDPAEQAFEDQADVVVASSLRGPRRLGDPVDLTGVDPDASTAPTGQAAADEVQGKSSRTSGKR